ncbi:DUF2190 family protein [Caulobacter vibrioides]|uniref:DUF2190 family protein n=1 Tax=Caulobacter vibrioides TaxID=155892 RepID=UPI000BB4AE3A|nr:DUF2190 family protein [Caulobacter vibrioides]ATC25205.1 DUF2190 domain-containing protein [Caulobacter vibrioides]PLR13975.1 DUF2190 domain-containing protein [Caulobacter vibrioides]
MKTMLSSGDRVNVTTPAGGLTSGLGALIGAMFGVAMNTTVQGDPNVLVREGEFTQPKATGEAWTQGQLLYWDNTNKRFTTTASGNTKAAVASAAQLAAATTGDVILVPTI